MCGLLVTAGASELNHRSALGLLDHRGVREKTAHVGRVTLSHARLPIVGLGEENDQPVTRPGWLLAFVGEVLDFRDTSPWRLESDVPLVADLWAERGPGCLRGRDGFWSVAAVNIRRGCRDDVYLLTDYLAQKPLYYRADGDGRMAAGSEPAAVASLWPTTPDETYLSAVVKWGYCPEPRRTPYREVKKTLPGEVVVIDSTAGRIASRWFVDRLAPRRADPAELRREIEAAVRRRVTAADVPVAALVSGGLDSGITWSLARGHADVAPFHVENGELDQARQVVSGSARAFRVLRHEEVLVEDALAWMQEPVDLGSLLPQCALSAAVGRAGFSVCLTGDGADEFFGGYGRAARYDSQASDVWHELQSWHLPRLDRVMMRNRVEVRSPFLARKVCEIALGLPREPRVGKKILRDLFRDDLPPGLADAPKRPLRTPAVEHDREGWSRMLVDEFRRVAWQQA